MIETLYNFFYAWLFNSTQPDFISTQGVEFICIVFTIIVMAFVVYVATIPIKAIINAILR